MPEVTPPSELVILRELLANEAGFVSGSALAEKLGVSRVAVWQHMEKLRTQGFGFQAVRARGYRLSKRPAELSATFLDALLANAGTECGVVLLNEVDSTNDEAARLLAAGHKTPFVVVARSQTRGRGRFGRQWHSEKSGNLYASFAFRPQLPPSGMQTFTLWMGVCVCELVASLSADQPGLKWPNDLLFGGSKAGGMLTEARMDADMIRDLVLGIGLNIATASAPGLAPTNSLPPTCLADHANEPIDINRFTAGLITRISEAYASFANNSYHDRFADLWNRYDLLRGRPIAVLQGERRFAGVAAGVDDEGALLLRDEKGSLQRFRAGEVSIDKSTLT